MVQRKQTKRPKPEEASPVKHRRVQDRQPEYDQAKAHDEDIARQAGASLESQAALLARAQSDEQRGRLLTHLQQTRGNAYVQRLIGSPVIQAKLTVSSPGDTYEREADRVAETVQRQEEDELQTKPSADVQRQPIEEEEPLQPKLTTDIQRQPIEEEEEEKPLQPKATEGQPQMVSDRLEAQIESARDSGQPLDGVVRQPLEARLGHDFSQVRIHTDSRADHLSRQLGAEAFTTGRDVFFREGTYQPQSASGKGLIAHELTHVVQQQAAPAIQRQTAVDSKDAVKDEAPPEPAPETAALKGLWDLMVVTQLRQAYESLKGEKPNPTVALEKLQSTKVAVGTVRDAFKSKPVDFAKLHSFFLVILNLQNLLQPHAGVTTPLTNITETINPEGEIMSEWLSTVDNIFSGGGGKTEQAGKE